MTTAATLVYDVAADAVIAVPVAEARAGLLRFARSLGPGSPACGVWEQRAIGPWTEITVSWGDDTICASCECPLPAGAPAWPAGDGAVLCNDCAETEG